MPETNSPFVLKFHPDPHERELIEFYTALGMCVSSWAFIDRRLYEIFHLSLGMEARQSALLFFRQRALNQRLRLVDDTVRTLLMRGSYDSNWRSLHTRIVDLSHTRNIFAHQPTRRLATSKDGKPHYVYSIYIEPYERILNNEYKGLLGKEELVAADLREHDSAIEVLERDLRDFIKSVIGPECNRAQNPPIE